jgi:hypothetical protein
VLVTLEERREAWDRPGLEHVTAGLPALPERPKADPTLAAVDGVMGLEQYRRMLSVIDPTMKDERSEYIGVVNAIREGQGLRQEAEEVDLDDLAHDWASGTLWGRTPETYTYADKDEFLADIASRRQEGGVGLGTLLKLANAGGFDERVDGKATTEVFAEYLSTLPANDAVPPAKMRFALRSEAVQDTSEPPDWLIEGLLPKVGTAAIHGSYGSFKTFGAIEAGLAVAADVHAFGGLPVNRTGPVIYMAAEGRPGLEKKRRPGWRQARDIPAKKVLPFYTVDEVPLARDPSDVNLCIAAIEAEGVRPVLIIIDTFARSMAGLNENDAAATQLFLEAIDKLARHFSCCVLVIAHDGKNPTAGARGSTALPAGVDMVWKMEGDEKAKTARIIPDRLKDFDSSDDATIYLQGREVSVPGGGKTLVFDQVDKPTLQKRSADDKRAVFVDEALDSLSKASAGPWTTPVLADVMVQLAELRSKAAAEAEGKTYDPPDQVREGLLKRQAAQDLSAFAKKPQAQRSLDKTPEGEPLRQGNSLLWKLPQRPSTGTLATVADFPGEE